jgi:hypothetical protein
MTTLLKKEAKSGVVAKEIKNILLDTADTVGGTVAGNVGGIYGGKFVGLKIHDRLLKNDPIWKKLYRKIRTVSPKYRKRLKDERAESGVAGAATGQGIFGNLGVAYDAKKMSRKLNYNDLHNMFGGTAGKYRGDYKSEAFRNFWKKHVAGEGRSSGSSSGRSSGSSYGKDDRYQRQYRPGGRSVDDYLKTIGIPKNIKTKAEAKKIHRKQVMKNHPDRNPGNKEADKNIREINAAWENIRESSWYEKLAFVLHKYAAKKSKKIDVEKLKELLDKAKSESKKRYPNSRLNKLIKKQLKMGHPNLKTLGIGLAAFGSGAALSRLASKAGTNVASKKEG